MIEQLIKKKVKKLNIKDINFNNRNTNIKDLEKINPDKIVSKQNNKSKFLPVENFLNFQESGKIPEFLKTKKSI